MATRGSQNVTFPTENEPVAAAPRRPRISYPATGGSRTEIARTPADPGILRPARRCAQEQHIPYGYGHAPPPSLQYCWEYHPRRCHPRKSSPTKVFTHESFYPRRFLPTKVFTHEKLFPRKLFPRKVIPSKVITFRVIGNAKASPNW